MRKPLRFETVPYVNRNQTSGLLVNAKNVNVSLPLKAKPPLQRNGTGRWKRAFTPSSRFLDSARLRGGESTRTTQHAHATIQHGIRLGVKSVVCLTLCDF